MPRPSPFGGSPIKDSCPCFPIEVLLGGAAASFFFRHSERFFRASGRVDLGDTRGLLFFFWLAGGCGLGFVARFIHIDFLIPHVF